MSRDARLEDSHWSGGEGDRERPTEEPADEPNRYSNSSGLAEAEAVKSSEAEACSATGSSSQVLQQGAGLLPRLSHSCHLATHRTHEEHLLGTVYNNINYLLKIAEQILGRKDAQENGTCATVFPLFAATPATMCTSDLIDTYDAAPPLSLNDIKLTPNEESLLQHHLEHAVLCIIVLYGGEAFARFHANVIASTPSTSEKIPLHKTEIFPLPAMNIDESKTTSNAEVMETIFAELGFIMTAKDFPETVKLVFGDQLSIARLCSLMNNRTGHDSVSQSYVYTTFGPGFFYHQMAVTHGLIETHWGDPSRGARDPGSLVFHNTVLNRKPIVLSSLPPYRTCHDLIFVSLYARMLHCLEKVSKCTSLEKYAANVTLNQLQEDASAIVTQYANPAVVFRLRHARNTEELQHKVAKAGQVASPEANNDTPCPTQGDTVFENMVLFLCDALILQEFTDAIKAGDSGHIILSLKVLTLAYCGSGQTKYAYELLHLIHNLEHVWPKPLRYVFTISIDQGTLT